MKKKLLALASLACALTMVMAAGCGDGNNGDDGNDDNNNTTQTPGGDNNDPTQTPGDEQDGNYKTVTYELIPSELEAVKYESDYANGIFTILGGTTIRTRSRLDYTVYDYQYGDYAAAGRDPVATGFNASKSIQYNGANVGFSVNAIAPGTLTFYLDNGSTGRTDDQHCLVTKPDGTTIDIAYAPNGMYAVTIDCDQIGVYKVTRGNVSGVGTTDVYYAKFVAKVEITPIEKIEVISGGKTTYMLNEDLDTSQLQVQATHETTGMIEPIAVADLDIDKSAYDKTKAGTYTIKVSYTDEDGNKFEDEYDVVVLNVVDLELGFNVIKQGSNTSYGNGTYINHAVQQFYFKGEELNLDGLTVNAVLEGGKDKMTVDTGYTISGYDKTKSGKQTVKLTWNSNEEVYAEFDVYVADYTVNEVRLQSEVVINVNGALEDEKVGTVESDAYLFQTIKQALDFFEGVGVGENTKKVINLAEGTYTEKVEITLPNLTIKGASNDATKTVIEWDALYGIADEGGFIHTTDSTATLNVRESATGFVIEDVTISNWYNSVEHFDEALGENYPEHRALAMLIQADKVVVENCRLLGYQDTLELFTGRQIFNNCYINGRTDFIFGTNNTTYFYQCEIESIVAGGYITAFKGNNKDANDAVTYGTIFDECKFTAPEEVVEKANTALGRTWGAYSAVAYINCEMDGHISKTTSRYVEMNAKPTADTVKFVEYGNTGDGALDSEVAGMTLLTAAEAANYSDFSVIFATTNGGVKYTDVWDGSKGVLITEKTLKFSDYYAANDGNKYHKTADTGEAFFGSYATVKGNWGHELDQNKDQAKFGVDTVITFNVVGEVTVTTYGKGYGEPENLDIKYVDGKAVITIKATDASPIANGCYITLIKIDFTKNPPAAN